MGGELYWLVKVDFKFKFKDLLIYKSNFRIRGQPIGEMMATS